MIKITGVCFCLIFGGSFYADAQTAHKMQQTIKTVGVADNGDGTYTNPVLHADYSDPDAIRVGSDYYMVSSSFEEVPGLPVLHSKDLVNWTIIGHALPRQIPVEHFAIPRHGDGVWAPAIRFHKGQYYIYYPDPDYGIYVIKATNPQGPWSEPLLVEGGKGLIDPCPLWDDDGQAYLVHAFAGSRAGIKSILVIQKMNPGGTQTIDEGKIVYDGHEKDPTLEGPKLYKRNGYYYIFAPAGGVPVGWQLVLRSKDIYGPYERKVVMDQGKSTTNGPHQGAWITTQTGEDWFLHFQDKDAYGRIMHLQPMKWVNDWPVIGTDADGDGKGEPVLRYKKPNVGKPFPVQVPAMSDEFNGTELGLQWQWMANPKASWYFMNPAEGSMRLYSVQMPDSASNLWGAPNMLLQKFPAEEFMITTKFMFHPNTKLVNERTGLMIMGFSYAGLELKSTKEGIDMVSVLCKDAEGQKKELETFIKKVQSPVVYFRIAVRKGAQCQFSYSFDDKTYIPAGDTFVAEKGRWIGARIGLFCSRETSTNDSGWADFDWFRVESLQN